MKAIIFKEFTLYCAHRVAAFGDDHKCNRIHGHSYRIRVEVESEVCDNWIAIAFDDIDAAWNKTCRVFDHTMLNDHADIGENATVERFAFVLQDRLTTELMAHVCICVKETDSSGVIFR